MGDTKAALSLASVQVWRVLFLIWQWGC